MVALCSKGEGRVSGMRKAGCLGMRPAALRDSALLTEIHSEE